MKKQKSRPCWHFGRIQEDCRSEAALPMRMRKDFLEAGASHVIVTSFVFKNGVFYRENLENLLRTVGKEHLVLDLSCRRKEDGYSIVTDRWQKFTDVKLSEKVLDELSGRRDEFLVHAVDAEGKAQGIERELADMLGRWQGIPVTYAGGVGSFADLQELKKLGRDHIDVTIGSALDLFGEACLTGKFCVCVPPIWMRIHKIV